MPTSIDTALGFLGPAFFGVLFVVGMGWLREPARRNFNAIFVAGAGAAYLNGGLGLWEFPFIAVATLAAYRGLQSYGWIGAAWLLHVAWDIVHHLNGTPIWPWSEMSSRGCAIFDLVLAFWFLAGAPPLLPRFWERFASSDVHT